MPRYSIEYSHNNFDPVQGGFSEGTVPAGTEESFSLTGGMTVRVLQSDRSGLYDLWINVAGINTHIADISKDTPFRSKLGLELEIRPRTMGGKR